MLRIAIYVSDHGFGHATRMSALANEFTGFGIYTVIRSSRPDYLFSIQDSSYFRKYDCAIDTGVKHHADLSADAGATKAALLELMSHRGAIIEREVDFLRTEGIDLVVADVPFLIAEICGYMDIPLIAVSNFDWLFIYDSLFGDDPSMRPVLNTIWGLYQRVNAAFMLPFGSKRGMASFPSLFKSGLLARTKEHYREIHREFDISPDDQILACTFGGEDDMLFDPGLLCRAYKGTVISRSECRAQNHRQAAKEDDWLDIIHGCDILLTKPGYSTFAEATQFGKTILYYPRLGYPEEELLIGGLKTYPYKSQMPLQISSIQDWRKVLGYNRYSGVVPSSFQNKNAKVAAQILAEYLRLKRNGHQIASVYDIGSNNLNYVLWDITDGEIIHSAQLTTGLGRGLDAMKGRVRISREAGSGLKRCFTKILSWEQGIPAKRIVLSASVARTAENYGRIASWLKSRSGVEPKVINETSEAKYAWRAAIGTLEVGKRPLVIDIGGLSTEFTWGIGNNNSYSIPIGLLNLVEDDRELDFQNILADLPIQSAHSYSPVILTGLTGAYLAREAKLLGDIPLQLTHGLQVSKDELKRLLIESSLARPIAHVSKPSFSITAILKASTMMVIQILDRLGASNFIVCYYGISTGFLLEKYTRPTRTTQ
jgi:hypothetical protein